MQWAAGENTHTHAPPQVCEKETKTKTYSKEGLARETKLDPEEQKKAVARDWCTECIEKIGTQVDAVEADLEKLSAAKSKKGNKVPNQPRACRSSLDGRSPRALERDARRGGGALVVVAPHVRRGPSDAPPRRPPPPHPRQAELETLDGNLKRHRWHILKLEQIIRLIDNDVVSPAQIDDVKEDVECVRRARCCHPRRLSAARPHAPPRQAQTATFADERNCDSFVCV